MDLKDLSTKVLLAKLLCAGLAVFDAVLGGASLLAPRAVAKAFSPGEEPVDLSLLRRTATIWLFFIPVQIWAAVRTEDPTALRAVAILRLQEVPADPTWLASGKGFGLFGKFGLAFAPIFNLVGGLFLWKVARDLDEQAGENADCQLLEIKARLAGRLLSAICRYSKSGQFSIPSQILSGICWNLLHWCSASIMSIGHSRQRDLRLVNASRSLFHIESSEMRSFLHTESSGILSSLTQTESSLNRFFSRFIATLDFQRCNHVV